MLELYGIALGALGGLFGTLAMSTIEAVAWKRWGLPGVFEWHENQMLVVRFLKLDSTRLHYGGIFGLHVANGLLGGVGFYLAVALIDLLGITIPLLVLGISYGFFLWILTLVPIHRPITGLHPWNHPLGHGPALVSLAGHLVYSAALTLFFLSL